MIGKQVWIVRHSHPDLFDCEGVYTTRKKALKAIDEDFERCSDIWLNRQDNGDETMYFIDFDLYDKILGTEHCCIEVFPMEIQ